MTKLAARVQSQLDGVATLMERVKNLFNGSVPLITCVFACGCLFSATVLYWVPVRYMLFLGGMNKFVMKGLRKYHPQFKRAKYHVPVVPALEALKRLPSDMETLQWSKLPHERDSEVVMSDLLMDKKKHKNV